MGSFASCIQSKNKELDSKHPSAQNISNAQKSSESIGIEEEYKRHESKKKKIEKHKEVSLSFPE